MNVLVIRFSSLGDCILLCPFLEHLKKSGAVEVTIVTKLAYAELFGAATGVDRIVALAPGGGLNGLFAIVRSQRHRDAVVIDAHNNWRSRLLSRGLGGAEARIEKFYRERVELILYKEQHTIPTISERYSALGEPLGMSAMECRPGGIHVPEAARERATSLMGDRVRPFVAVAPGSRWPMKEWALDKFEALAEHIAERYDQDIVLLGDASDAAATAQFASRLGERAVDLAGRTSVTECASILERATAFVGNDSGLMHLAEAMDTPVLALFGPTVEAFGYYPSLPGSKVVERALDCRPCSRNGGRDCPLGTQACLRDIPVGAAEEAFADLINGQGPRRYCLN